MKVLITGAGGFVGNYVMSYLSNFGIDTIGVVRKKQNNSKFEYAIGDLFEGVPYQDKVDIIIHTAAQNPKEGIVLEDYIRNNIIATQSVIEYAKRFNVKKIVFLGAVSSYGEIRTGVLNDDTDYINGDFYSLTKRIAENLIKESKIPYTILILPGVVGKGCNPSWITHIVESMINNEKIHYYNPDTLFNNIVHVKDLSEFILSLIKCENITSEKLFLGTEELKRLEDVLMIIKKETNSYSTLEYEIIENKSFYIDVKKSIELGYHSMSLKHIISEICTEIKKG